MVKNKPPLISIIIPMYNEERSIQEVIKSLPNHENYEIIIVNDGSTDDSVKKINELNSNIKIISHERNRGYGASVLSGMNYAKGEIRVTMDADGQHDPKEITKLITPIIKDYADVVVGSRYLGRSTYKIPLHTKAGEYLIAYALKFLYGYKIFNNQSGFRAFNRKSILVFYDLVSTKFGFCTETLFKAAYNNLRLMEVPITIDPRKFGVSYVKLIDITRSIFLTIILYTIKKFKKLFGKIIPKKLLDKLYSIIQNKIKNL